MLTAERLVREWYLVDLVVVGNKDCWSTYSSVIVRVVGDQCGGGGGPTPATVDVEVAAQALGRYMQMNVGRLFSAPLGSLQILWNLRW